jgi:hypothetical protein
MTPEERARQADARFLWILAALFWLLALGWWLPVIVGWAS